MIDRRYTLVMAAPKTVAIGLTVSMAIAACIVPFLDRHLNFTDSLYDGFALTAAWVVLLAVSLILRRTRTRWLWVGVPFALFWPGTLAFLFIAGAITGRTDF